MAAFAALDLRLRASSGSLDWAAMHPRFGIFRWKALSALVMGCSVSMRGQARATATQVAHLAVFGEYETLSPHHVGNPQERGFVGGVDYNRVGGPIPISFEARGTYTPTGRLVGQRSGTVGVRLDVRHRHFARIRPYGDFLFGVGEIQYGPDYNTGSTVYRSDNSLVFNYGAGLNYAFVGNFALQGEFQQQHWNLGNANSPELFRPTMIDFGLRYTVPFRPRYGR